MKSGPSVRVLKKQKRREKMGQKLGRAVLCSAAEPYSNISRQGILRVWQAFNDIADGFGLSQDEFEEISTVLTDELNVTRLAMV